MIVLKFGGTSIQDAEWIDRALDIVEGELNRAPVVVASAMGKTTDELQKAAYSAGEGKESEAFERLKAIENNHILNAERLLSGTVLAECVTSLRKFIGELTATITVLCQLKEWTKRANDAVLSFGERLSTTILAARCKERALDHVLLDSRQIVKTDSAFTAATPLLDLTNACIARLIHPQQSRIILLQGFVGSTESGVTSTLGRGGSDFTATIIGAGLRAEEVQIWTDVDGIMTCDPKVIANPITISKISYREAAELAYFGARVIHPSTLQPAMTHDIPVWVKNTAHPDKAGTQIVSQSTEAGLKAIAFKKDIIIINITSSRMLLAYGFMKRIFDTFEQHETSIDLIATSEVSVSVTIDDATALEAIRHELSDIGIVTIERNMSIISLVGQELWRDSHFLTKVFNSLDTIPIRVISLGASDVNLSFVVSEKWTETTVKKLHSSFFSAGAHDSL